MLFRVLAFVAGVVVATSLFALPYLSIQGG